MPPTKTPTTSSQDLSRNLPRHSINGSKRERSRASSIHSPNVRLSIIEEDGDIPPLPAKAHHRPFHRRWNLGEPPRFSYESPPPKYSVWDATKGPKGEKLGDVRNNKHIARRGGWRRICLIAILLVATVVALVAGLVVGLHRKNSKQSQPSSSSSSPDNTTQPFPVGSYTLTTYLSTVATSCTSQSQDWSCWPYHTYSDSASEALANFTVTITSSGNNSFAISNPNTLSIGFQSTPLTLLDANTENERYHFSTMVDKITTPSLGVQCFFNDTTLAGDLYTKKTQIYTISGGTAAATPPPPPTPVGPRDDFQPWPYAVDMQQSIGGGNTVPQCFRVTADGRRGDRIVDGLTPQAVNEMCSCEYKNFDK
ncbi:MAG: hypothetical protein Q9218_005366 [Villophora microphyllina]